MRGLWRAIRGRIGGCIWVWVVVVVVVVVGRLWMGLMRLLWLGEEWRWVISRRAGGTSCLGDTCRGRGSGRSCWLCPLALVGRGWSLVDLSVAGLVVGVRALQTRQGVGLGVVL